MPCLVKTGTQHLRELFAKQDLINLSEAVVYALASLLTGTITNHAVAVLLTPLIIGLPLNVLTGVAAVLLIPYFWPLQA